MSDSVLGQFDLTIPVTLAFPNLSVARSVTRNGKATGEPKFSANLVFEPDNPDVAGMKATAIAVVKASKEMAGIPMKDLRWPFKDGSKLADKRAEERRKQGKEPDGEFQRGKLVLVSRSKFRPALAAVINGKAIDLDPHEMDEATLKRMIEQHFYFGALVLAQVKFNAYPPVEEGDRAGVNAYLQQVFATGQGKRLSATRSAAATFRGYVGHATTEDPSGGMADDDDEIPF